MKQIRTGFYKNKSKRFIPTKIYKKNYSKFISTSKEKS
jgi:hypothetical protein